MMRILLSYLINIMLVSHKYQVRLYNFAYAKRNSN
jgi:hypothetical protein